VRIVVKIGGTLLEEPQDRLRIAASLARQVQAGHQMLVIHGGGKQLTRYLEQAGIASRFVNGLRVTDAPSLDGVIKVFAGTVNHQLLAALHQAGVVVAGISGVDGGCLRAEKLRGENGEDWGFVGRITGANPHLWNVLLQGGILPVMACLAVDGDGRIYNVNADQAAVACAIHLPAEGLVFLTDVEGVRDGPGRTLACLHPEEIASLIQSGAVTGGMLAKLNAVREALAGKVPRVQILDGRSLDGRTEDALDAVLDAWSGRSAEAAPGTMILGAASAAKRA